jgi:hypothetical protein
MMKHTPVETIQVCLDTATRAALHAAAREEDRSASAIVRMALRAYLRRPAAERVTAA